MTLVRKPMPYPSESLAGLIARAAGMNIYPRAYDVLVQAGLGATRPTSLALKGRGYAEKLAEVLGVDASTVIPLFHGAADHGGRFDFFGIKLRTIHREPGIRRVSPRALSKAPYIRAIWHIRPFSFDPETHELLLSHCPVCSTQLGFNRTRGVTFCDVCEGPDRFGFPSPTVDLRDLPQPLVEVDDMEALDFVTSLVDPNPDVRNNYAPALAEELSGLDRADLFEMVLAVAAAIEMNADPDFVPSPQMYRAGTRQVEPSVLAAAGRAVLQWPDGFLRLTTEARLGASKRPGLWGVLKELGALGMLPRDAHIAPAVVALFEQAHRRYFATSKPIEGVVRRADYETKKCISVPSN